MRLDVRVTSKLAVSLVRDVAEELDGLLDAGAEFVEAESAAPTEGEAHRVVVRSDKLPEPKVIAVREDG